MEIRDNLIPADLVETIERSMQGESFPWFATQNPDDLSRDWKLTHPLFIYTEWYNRHDWFDELLTYLPIKTLVRAKANLQVGGSLGEWHSDECDPDPTAMTSVYYVNTCNGYTEFVDGDKVESKAGRVVTFHNAMQHRAVMATDVAARFVISVNYFV